jgi:arsenite methyltransferase
MEHAREDVMGVVTDEQELGKYLAKIDKIFDGDSIIGEEVGQNEVVDYYTQSDFGYRVFHSMEGSIHMAMNYDGVFRKDGYYEQARLVGGFLRRCNAKMVLELGSGNGFNSLFLAKRNPGVQFHGIDLTPLHVSVAQKRAGSFPNVAFQRGDFQEMSFKSRAFDLVFEVESVCHASDMKLALSEIHRVLKPGGMLVMFDGFRKPDFHTLDPDLKRASRMVEVCMAVEKPFIIDEFLTIARRVGFNAEAVEDYSEAIMPNLARFQRMAKGYYKYPFLSRLILRLLPAYLVKNSVSGLLMPFTLVKAQGYYLVVLRR